MTWMLRWQLHRSVPLASEELALVESVLDPVVVVELGDGKTCVARGWSIMPHDRTDQRWTAVLDGLTTVRSSIRDGSLLVDDDRMMVEWNAGLARYEFAHESVRDPFAGSADASSSTPSSTASAARVAPATPTTFEDDTAVPQPLAHHAEGAASRLGSVVASPVDQQILRQLEAIVATRDSFDLRRTLERTCEPMAVARVALALLPICPERSELPSLLRTTLAKIADLAPLRDQLAELWHLPAIDRHWRRDLATTLEAVASEPTILALAAEVVENADVADNHRLAAAIRLLGHAHAAAEHALPVLVARARRDRARLTREASWRSELIYALRDLAQPAAFATLLLDCESEDPPGWSRLVAALLRCDADRTLAIAPRLLHVPEVAGELASALGDVRSESAIALLRQLAAHALPRTRGLVARQLLRHGNDHLALVAAIWSSLDAGVSTEDINSYDRDDALAALGADKGRRDIDWQQLVVAMGLSPEPLPPLPSPIDNLTHPDGYVRSRALRALEEHPSPDHLLAVGLAAEVQALTRRRFSRIEDYTGWYRWSEAADMPPWLQTARDRIPELIRAHAGELPNQKMTATLQMILERGTPWFVETLPAPVLRLSDQERAGLLAEERAVIDRGRNVAAVPATISTLPDLADLFTTAPLDSQGPVMTSRDDARFDRDSSAPTGAAPAGSATAGVAIKPSVPIASADHFEIHNSKARLLRTRGDGRDLFDFVAQIEPRSRYLRLDGCEMIARDPRGIALAIARQTYQKHLRFATWVEAKGSFASAVLEAAATLELRATWRESFRVRIAHAPWPLSVAPGAIDDSKPIPLLLTADPGARDIAIAASLIASPHHRSDRIDLKFLLEMRTGRNAESTALHLSLALRNRGGSVLEQRMIHVTLTAGEISTFAELALRLSAADLSRAHLIDIAVQGSRTIVDVLASYRL
jgi:hypothetical protein